MRTLQSPRIRVQKCAYTRGSEIRPGISGTKSASNGIGFMYRGNEKCLSQCKHGFLSSSCSDMYLVN